MAVYLMAVISAVLSITGEAVCWEHLHVKYGLFDGFYDIPKTVTAVLKEKYVKMAHDDELNVDLYALPGDPRVSIMFDTFGNIAGMRTAYIKSDVEMKAKIHEVKFPYTYDDKPIFTSGNYFGMDLWYTSVLFINPDKLKAGGREETGGHVAEDVYLKLDGKWTKIPKDECKAKSIGFTKQSCFTGMGMHYFYKVTPDMDCNDYQGVFVLYEGGELIGLGFNPYGSHTAGRDREWFEYIPPPLASRVIPSEPKCMKKWVETFGVSSFRIFFKKFPRLTFCIWPWQKGGDQCSE